MATVGEVAARLRDGAIKNVVFLLGAGVSVAAGIPDFRSPRTGLYDNVKDLGVPTPEAVFDLKFFVENPHPFYRLAKKLWPAEPKPTLFHHFVAMMAAKGIVRRVYTQNIDTLERSAGVPPDLLIEAHGSFASAACVKCRRAEDVEAVRATALAGDIPVCRRTGCGGYIKPDIVFFGARSPLPFLPPPPPPPLPLSRGPRNRRRRTCSPPPPPRRGCGSDFTPHHW